MPARRRLSSRHALAVALVVALGALGCGSVTAASTIGDAEHELAEAQGLQAEENAPYEYTRAAAYLKKAKELQGMGLYEQAGEYARRSHQDSQKALDVARLARDRQKRKERFAPPKAEPRKSAPGFTPSGD